MTNPGYFLIGQSIAQVRSISSNGEWPHRRARRCFWWQGRKADSELKVLKLPFVSLVLVWLLWFTRSCSERHGSCWTSVTGVVRAIAWSPPAAPAACCSVSTGLLQRSERKRIFVQWLHWEEELIIKKASDHLYSIFRVPTWGLSRQQELCTAKQSFPWVWPWALLSRVLDSSVRWSAKSAPYEVKDKLPLCLWYQIPSFSFTWHTILKGISTSWGCCSNSLTTKWRDTNISL